MSSPRKQVNALANKLDAMGIETAVVVFRDPDSHAVMTIRRGDPCWLSGALRMIEQEVTDNWVTVKRPPPNDDLAS